MRLLTRHDGALLHELYTSGANMALVEPLAIPNDSFFIWIFGQLWSLPMVLSSGGQPVAVAFTMDPNLQSLNARLVALCADPGACHQVLALYVRHLFWSFPLHRLYAYCPRSPEVAAYGDLFADAGFAAEGCLKEHRTVGGEPADVDMFGVLRDDFERWSRLHHPELSLASEP